VTVGPTDELASLRRRIADLEHELAARDEFIAAVGHELRNPIAPVCLHLTHLANMAKRQTDGMVSTSWLLPQLDKFSQRLERFVTALDRLLDVSHMRAGRLDLQLESVDLVEVVRDIIPRFERELLAAGSALTFDAPAPVNGIWDRLRLEQIVSNLLSNAIRYGNSGPIRISVFAEAAQAVLSVADRGPGIPEPDRERIFDRFERAGAHTRGGFGVGLWIVDRLSRAMGGSVTLQSHLGEGSTFIVRLHRIERGMGP